MWWVPPSCALICGVAVIYKITNSRLDDVHGTPGHRRGNDAEKVLATNLKRGGSHEEGVRQQLVKVLWAEYSPPTQVGNVAGIQRNTGCSMNGVTAHRINVSEVGSVIKFNA